jgi:hypothetical protein
VHVLLPKPLIMPAHRHPPFACDQPSMIVPPEPMHAFTIHPRHPIGRVAFQHVGSEDTVASGVLYVDVQVRAAHVHHDV